MNLSELENRLRKHAEKVKNDMQPPFDLKEEIKNTEEPTMSKKKVIIKRTVLFAAILALCITTIAITPLAKSVKGFFSDIIGVDGAVTGTRYENATGEVKVNGAGIVNENGNIIVPLEFTFENSEEAPFSYIEEIAIAEYKILDSDGEKITDIKVSAKDGDKATVDNGKATINIYMSDKKFKTGEEYTVVIEKMHGFSKADAPLHITGVWECKFAK